MKKIVFFLAFIFLIFPVLAVDSCTETTGCAVISPADSDFTGFDESYELEHNHVCIIYFYSPVCSSCSQTTPLIAQLEDKYDGIVIFHRYDVSELRGYELYNKLCSIQSILLQDRYIPLVGIGNDILMGVDAIKNNLEEKINYYLMLEEKPCPLPGDLSCSFTNYTIDDSEKTHIIPDFSGQVTLPLIIGAGLVDGINPCAFAVMIFFVSYLISMAGNRKKIIKAGIAYITSVYITYLLAGLGLLSVIQFSGVSGIVYQIAAFVAIIVGIINIKDYFWYGKGITFKIPESRKPTIQSLTAKANIPAAVVLGFLVAMFELPCTGGVYFAVLAMLANVATLSFAIPALLLYNFMFVLPLAFLLILLLKGMSAEKLEDWRTKRRNWMKLATGILLVVLGVAMLLNLI
ncbi:MAG: cytochrome c biogenesis CcdA family protein [Candidatus Nanoarchaeia archaeon]|nr:cytochrome c biogenesis CcdA family protein [Candidatus Nanoarchaeia archaeon]